MNTNVPSQSEHRLISDGNFEFALDARITEPSTYRAHHERFKDDVERLESEDR